MKRSEGEWWATQFNVEVAFCLLPSLEQVLDGVFTVAALGNDGTPVHIILSSEEAAKVDADAVAQIEMAWLGKALMAVRRDETLAGLL